MLGVWLVHFFNLSITLCQHLSRTVEGRTGGHHPRFTSKAIDF